MLQNLAIKDFVEELYSKSPAPGGGSAAALSASLASALMGMVFNLTIGKKEYNGYNEKIKDDILNALEEVNLSKNDFLDFMNKDAEAFLRLMDAFRLPKNTEEEINTRKDQIKKGNIESVETPLKVAKKAVAIYDYILIGAKFGNKNTASDAGVAALLLQTAIEGAILNVKINIAGIKDEEYKNNMQQQCKYLVEEGISKKEKIMKIINLNIG